MSGFVTFRDFGIPLSGIRASLPASGMMRLTHGASTGRCALSVRDAKGLDLPTGPKNSARAFGAAWLAQDDTARSILPADGRTESWLRSVQCWDTGGVPVAVTDALDAQARRWNAPPAAHDAITRLRDRRACAVVTGQQCGFLLGPGYTVYKALSAIAWAQQAEQATGRPTVPVFWLQTEDHDAAEIATAHVLSDSTLLEVAMPMDGHDRTSVAHRVVTEGILDTFEALDAAWEAVPHGAEVLAGVRRAWAPGRRVVDAFAETLYRWLGPLGLVVLDPRDPALAGAARSVHEHSLFDAKAVQLAFDTRDALLTKAGFKVQIPLRSGCTLSFYHPDGPAGPRYRVLWADDGFRLAGHDQVFSADELRAVLKEAPERFSTSALLRPLLQECWLPTVATVVGPGELSYFGQLGALFETAGRRAPAVIPRARARLWTSTWRRAFDRGGFSEANLSEPRDEVLARFGREHTGAAAVALKAGALDGPLAALDAFIADVSPTDPGTARRARRTRRTLERSMTRLLSRHERATAVREDRRIGRLDQLRAALFPKGAPQERVLSPLHFAARMGERALVDVLRDALPAEAAGKQTEVELW